VHTNVKAIYTKNGFHSSLDVKTIHRNDNNNVDGNELMAVGIILEESPFYSEAGGQV
jgi:alanyl-tRNA synthetase